jgi:hypothetical protein
MERSMTRFINVVAASLLLAAASAPSQTFYHHLPRHLQGPWIDQHAVFAMHEATIQLPEGWSIQEGGIAVSEAERQICRIDFVPTPGLYKDALARELAADRKTAREAIHSELCCGGDREIVSVRYASVTGKVIEKRYFELPSSEGSELLSWMVTASSTREGEECVQRFRMVADSLRIKPQRRPVDGAPPN